ncbi:MAG: 5'-nucleotidase [Chloroflexi bacterium]|nr:5'-nucleotidase [Chloroflexota bacterium]
MPAYAIEKRLVVAVSSNALFDLTKEDHIFKAKGLKEYREYQKENKNKKLEKGSAFHFVERFLGINKVYSEQQPVEVIILSKNSPETGVRIMNSIKEYGLAISRGAFTSGDSPYKYISAYNVSLYLSTNKEDVEKAIQAGHPAGRFINTSASFTSNTEELRVAFDFDGVVADDEAEKIYQKEGIEKYFEYETKHANKPLKPGPLADFFKKLALFQKLETRKQDENSTYKKIIRTAIITARNAPAHLRAINTLKAWDVTVDDLFLLGGIEKRRILEIWEPHLFMDDQISHLDPELKIPLVHVPFHTDNT